MQSSVKRAAAGQVAAGASSSTSAATKGAKKRLDNQAKLDLFFNPSNAKRARRDSGGGTAATGIDSGARQPKVDLPSTPAPAANSANSSSSVANGNSHDQVLICHYYFFFLENVFGHFEFDF